LPASEFGFVTVNMHNKVLGEGQVLDFRLSWISVEDRLVLVVIMTGAAAA